MQHEAELRAAFQKGYEAAMKDMRGETESIQMRDNTILSPETSEKVFSFFKRHTQMNEQEIRHFVYMFYYIHEEGPEWSVYGDNDPAIVIYPNVYSLKLNSWGKYVVGEMGLQEIPLYRSADGWVYKQVVKDDK